MKREIKFRAWDSYQKCMYNWNDLGVPTNMSLWNYLNGDNNYILPMMFSGLNDKNGVEIYDYDIVKIEWKNIEISPEKYDDKIDIVVVEFISGAFWIDNVPLYVHCEKQDYRDDIPLCEVIGNVFENPELINK